MTEEKKSMSAEERKAFGEKMKLAREAKANKEPQAGEPAEETIAVPKSVLEDLQADIKAMKKDNAILMQVADKKALAHHYQRNQEDLPKIIRLRTLDVTKTLEDGSKEIKTKVIVGWRTISNEVTQIAGTQTWKEDQVIELTFEDQTTIELQYVEFVRKYGYVQAKVISSMTDEATKDLTLKVRREDNSAIVEIGVKFVN